MCPALKYIKKKIILKSNTNFSSPTLFILTDIKTLHGTKGS